jgi:hypothetical protein
MDSKARRFDSCLTRFGERLQNLEIFCLQIHLTSVI